MLVFKKRGFIYTKLSFGNTLMKKFKPIMRNCDNFTTSHYFGYWKEITDYLFNAMLSDKLSFRCISKISEFIRVL